MSLLGRLLGLGRNEAYDRGVRLFDQGRFAEAIDALERAQDTPDPLTDRLASFYLGEAHAHLGQRALEENRPAEARTSLQKALHINPQYADLHFHLGRACRVLSDPAAALAAFEAALAVNPRYARALFFKGLTLYELGQPDRGRADVRDAAALDPGFGGPLFDEAEAAHAAGDFQTARTRLARLAETDVDDVTFHARLGADLYGRGLYAEAAKEFEAALAQADYADLHNGLGVTRHAQGLYPEAIAEFEAALALKPRYTDARANLGLTLRAAGRPDEARRALMQVLEDDPGHALARLELTR